MDHNLLNNGGIKMNNNIKFNNIKLNHNGKEISIAQHYRKYPAKLYPPGHNDRLICQEVFDGENIIEFNDNLDSLIDALIKIRDKE